MDRLGILFGCLIIFTGSASSAFAGEASALGTVLGATAGAVLGNQIGEGRGRFVSTTLGLATGGMVGNMIGQSIDREFSYRSVSMPDFDGNRRPTTYFYTYAPNYVAPPTYIDRHTQSYCRPYSQEILIDGYRQESYGTACLQPDGSWRIVP
ncbi:MAG: glycine zipper 2TM domain-containing protein [Alphaproteobacteria bacterium]|nr:glycine zipper 2TM domain-containing protein [Alphaproteobacteria bacterium]